MRYNALSLSGSTFTLMPGKPSRRDFLRAAVSAGSAAALRWAPAALLYGGTPPAFARSGRPSIPYGVASGDIMSDRAVVWSRSDGPAWMVVDYSFSDDFRDARRATGPASLAAGDFTAKVVLTGLPADREVFYRVTFEDLSNTGAASEPAFGRFRTAPAARRDVRFLWSADTAGQGWGINPDLGGMTIYDTMRREEPDFFIHCGDTIYADNPIEAERRLPDGSMWRNLTTESKSKVAETLDEFRGNFLYNLMDVNVRAFNSEVPLIVQWDDHDTVDNWYPGKILDDERYTVKSATVLSSRARRAFLEYNPVRLDALDPERIHRTIRYGPSLDVFVVDMRSYRGPNGANDQEGMGPETALLGAGQIEWLKRALAASRATWKVIASGQSIGLIVYDDWRSRNGFESAANGGGAARGRELELGGLLSFIRHRAIENVVWLTGDVHYTAAHYYDPDKARYQDFTGFWEFVSGPLNAGTFGPNDLDDTFGPQVRFQRAPDPGQYNLPPNAGLQFYGGVSISGIDEVMTVALKDASGATLYSVMLEPA